MVAAPGDHSATDGEKREPRNSEPVGPRLPRPRLVDDRLANVEHHRPNRHRIIVDGAVTELRSSRLGDEAKAETSTGASGPGCP